MIINFLRPRRRFFIPILLYASILVFLVQCHRQPSAPVRERISINESWRFFKYDSFSQADPLIYDVRPNVEGGNDFRIADEKPTEAVEVEDSRKTLKAWIMPSGNRFISDPSARYERPEKNPGGDFPFVQSGFDDSSWEELDLPHDWAIEGPFYQGWNVPVGGGMGRLPVQGVAWYRKSLEIPASDSGKSIFLDVDGAMSYAMVWVNGQLAGGWPYGYASWRLDLTPYVLPGGTNQLAIRIDNPPNSSRWYPGAGIYRSVWLTRTHPVHVGQWGTFVTTPEVSKEKAVVHLEVTIDNDSENEANIEAISKIYALNEKGNPEARAVAEFDPVNRLINGKESVKIKSDIIIEKPKLWGPLPNQEPNRYLMVTTLKQNGKPVDRYETPFGIRMVQFDPDSGVFINGERIYIKGANQHHDLGGLGAAFNYRAAERQLEILQEMGCNSIRTAHNPPAPELLELTDKMGILVVNEIFDCWERKKTPLDFHLIFPEWHEQDLRAFMQRDRNHPSVIIWGLGNEVGEQYTGQEGVKLAEKLNEIAKDMDTTRPTTISVNFARPPMALPGVMDIINLNYQGEGIRDAPAYSHLKGIRTSPLYPAFHKAYPDKLIISSENASTLSSRGEYIFPVFDGISAPAEEGKGTDPETMQVSAYEFYTAQFGASPDKVFRSLEKHPYVGGGYVWTGWDYLGEPTPFYLARSSYYGIIDLAGFPKDRFYLYQAHWRPELPMVHILPHWNWTDRVNDTTPVHIFTSGDKVELFLNGKSLGRKTKGEYEYRIRWDDVIYEPGELKAVAYKDGKFWADEVIKTTRSPSSLAAKADRQVIRADGKDLSYITVEIVDENGLRVPDADIPMRFSIEGPGEIVATDNGDPTDFNPFPSHERKAFNGLALVIVRSMKGEKGEITVSAEAEGLSGGVVVLESR